MTNITENLLSYSYKFVEITELERQLTSRLNTSLETKIYEMLWVNLVNKIWYQLFIFQNNIR